MPMPYIMVIKFDIGVDCRHFGVGTIAASLCADIRVAALS
jgi:hypothetical protein